MCFCFDGESALVGYRPEECSERLPAVRAGLLRPDVSNSYPRDGEGAIEATPSPATKQVSAYPLW
jgi:hypothetical protein